MFHDLANNRLEDVFIGRVVHSIPQRIVNSVVLTSTNTYISELSCARKEFAISMKRYSHYTISGVECLLYTVSMMNININI